MSRELDDFMNGRHRNPRQKDFFDSQAEGWDTHAVHDPAKKAYIVSKLDLEDGMSILDVGTGTGTMIPDYLGAMNGGHVTALDYSENMIEVAKSKFPESERLSYRVQDLYDLKEDGVYDRVVCYSCFPHFPDPLKAIEVLSGALKKGGLFCIAHSASGKEINDVHSGGGLEICMDSLPPMELLLEMYGICGLETVFSRDDGMYYMAVGRK